MFKMEGAGPCCHADGGEQRGLVLHPMVLVLEMRSCFLQVTPLLSLALLLRMLLVLHCALGLHSVLALLRRKFLRSLKRRLLVPIRRAMSTTHVLLLLRPLRFRRIVLLLGREWGRSETPASDGALAPLRTRPLFAVACPFAKVFP